MITTIIGIISIVIGFLCIAAAFYTFMKKKPPVWSVGFGLAAFIFVTVIPVFLAVFFATMPGDVTR
ncbi:hypothetical protein [Corynebacterium comes]|uniref:Uncharacterized protein n=1 Tax=Corynebacterium comes TaxID=2675218 RepID=A0A6B8WGS8_9CORY|nr:hypothetical protein [Corynebacterium comes]QGU05788.1 hypothetical protein CETAM_12815 [Corynebacterium comes]